MYWCQSLDHPSKQFWDWFCGMAFIAAVVLLMSSFSIILYLREQKTVIEG
jgi:hypothetical protein